jgi:hypothetical protein
MLGGCYEEPVSSISTLTDTNHPSSMENTIQDLAERAWSQYDKFSGEHPVVEPPSIPILYFGNLESYADSNRIKSRTLCNWRSARMQG